jgi:CheY-like chemotaxis protein
MSDGTHATPERQPIKRPATILFADDSAVLRKSMGGLLRSRGFVVDCVADGLEAVEAVNRTTYDLILLDIQMPGMGGIEAASLIRSLGGTKSRVFAVSAEPDGIEISEQAGIDGILAKPIRAREIERLFEQPSRSD